MKVFKVTESSMVNFIQRDSILSKQENTIGTNSDITK